MATIDYIAYVTKRKTLEQYKSVCGQYGGFLKNKQNSTSGQSAGLRNNTKRTCGHEECVEGKTHATKAPAATSV